MDEAWWRRVDEWRQERDARHAAAGDGAALIGKIVRWSGPHMATSPTIGVVVRTERYYGPGGGWCCCIDRGDPTTKPLVCAVEIA